MPTRSERIRERKTTSSESSSIGICTRRPSLVTTTATRRRSKPFEVRKVGAVYVAFVPGATRRRLPPGRTRRGQGSVTRMTAGGPTVIHLLLLGLLPALTGLKNESRAREGHQRDEDSKVDGLEDGLHGYDHRIPAPTVRAIAPSSMTAQVKRARFAFTGSPSQRGTNALSDRRPGGLPREIPGFASPPRDGFALDDRQAMRRLSSRPGNVSPGGQRQP